MDIRQHDRANRRRSRSVIVTVAVAAGSVAGLAGMAGMVAGAAPAGASSSFCRAAVAQKSQEAKEIQAATGTPAQLKKFMQQSLAELPAFQALAPSQIKGAVATIVAEDRALFKALQADGYSYEKLPASVTSSVENPKFTQANEKIVAYLSKVCGIKTSTPTT